MKTKRFQLKKNFLPFNVKPYYAPILRTLPTVLEFKNVKKIKIKK